MKKRWDAITVGEIYIDHVFSGLANWPQPGEEIFTRTYLRELGGGAAITACGWGGWDAGPRFSAWWALLNVRG